MTQPLAETLSGSVRDHAMSTVYMISDVSGAMRICRRALYAAADDELPDVANDVSGTIEIMLQYLEKHEALEKLEVESGTLHNTLTCKENEDE